jgi:hypothetical protein
MSGPEFEAYVGGVLRYNGYLVEFTKTTRDFGVDLIARRGAETVAVQCKRQIQPVGAKAVKQVAVGAVRYDCTSIMVITNQSFAPAAVVLANRRNCVLIDGPVLSRLATGWKPELDICPLAKNGGPSASAAMEAGRKRAKEMTMFELFTTSARTAVVLAQEEARELDAAEIRPEHLLVGVLQSAGRGLSRVLSDHGLSVEAVQERLAESVGDESFDDDAEALRHIGIDLYAVREAATRTFGADAWKTASRQVGRSSRRSHIPFNVYAQKVLEQSLRAALAHKDNWIGCEHIMLGILRGGDKFTLGLITEHVGTSVMRGVVDLLDKAA